MSTTKSDHQKAIDALDKMAQIVEAEMIVQGLYADPEVSDESKSTNICGGRKYCAIGALGVAAGLKPFKKNGEDTREWTEFTSGSSRYFFVRNRPPLDIALRALDDEANEYMEKHDVVPDLPFKSPIENLFESRRQFSSTKRGRKSLISLIRRAQKRIERGLV